MLSKRLGVKMKIIPTSTRKKPVEMGLRSRSPSFLGLLLVILPASVWPILVSSPYNVSQQGLSDGYVLNIP
jgi:hypothetical protein